MSGHSKWATTHRQKSATDAKKGALFTKLSNLITIAAREGGGDIENNFKLRLAVEKAKAANMPKDNIQKAIDKGTGKNKEGSNFEEVIYEVIGPDGSVFMIEAVTDNKNRTVANLKALINKNGGQLGSSNSVAWMFERKGRIIIDASQLNEDKELEIIDSGIEDLVKEENECFVYTSVDNLNLVSKALKEKNIKIKETELIYSPKNQLEITDQESQEKIEKLYNLLEEMDDISNVYTNVNW